MANAATVITASTVVRGRIEGSEDLDIQGRVEGQIELGGAVDIDAAARVDGAIEATSIYVHGVLVGNGSASDTIHLTAEARVIGDLTAPKIIIDDGAKIRGLVDMGPSSAAAAPSRAAQAAQTVRPTAAPAEEEPADKPATPATGGKKASSKKGR